LKFTPLRVTLIYLIFAVIWIFASDYLAEILTNDFSAYSSVQTYKGIFYVCFTALILFLMMKSYENYIAKKEREFETLIHDTSAGMAVLRDKMIESSNASFQKIFKLENRDQDLKITDFLQRDDKNRFLKLIQDKMDADTWESAEFRFQLAGGELIWVMVTARNIELDGNQRKLLTVEDITERKQFQIYTELLLELILSIDPVKDLKQALDSVLMNICERIDWDFAEAWVPGKTNSDKLERVICWARDIPEIKEFDKKCRNYSFFVGEGIPGLAAREKKTRWIKNLSEHDMFERRDMIAESGLKTAIAVPVVVDQDIFAVLMFYSILEIEEDPSLIRLLSAAANDISVKLKQKKDQKVRAKAEENLKLALESAGMATWQVNIKTGEVDSSNTFSEMLGFKNRPVNDVESLSKNIVRKDRKKVDEAFEKSLREVVPFNVEFRVQKADGTISWLWARGKPILENGALTFLRGVTTIINQRKQLEQKLDREREFLDQLFKNLPVMITTYQPGPDVLEVNSEFEKLTGYSSENLENVDVMEAVYPNPKERKKVTDFMSNPGSGWMDFNMRTKWGTIVKSTWTNIQLSDETLVGIGIDIRERVEREEKLLESEYILEESQKVANLGSYYLDLETHKARTSVVLDKIFGAPEDDPMTLEKWEKMVHPDFQHVVMEFKNALESQTAFSSEYKIVRQDNHEDRWVFEKAEIIRDQNGSTKAMIGIIQDITEYKEQEELLVRQQDRLKQAQKIAGVGHFEYNIETGKLEWGEMVFELFGLDPETFDVTPENFLERVHPEDRQKMNEAYATIAEQKEMDLSYRVIKPDGTTGHFQQNGSFQFGENGKPYIVSGTVLDITELKKAENELREKEYFLSEAQSAARIGTYYLDFITGEAEISDIMREILGFSNMDPVNIDRWKAVIHPDDKERVINYLENEVIADGKPFDLQYRIIRESDGRLRWIHGIGKLEFSSSNNPDGMIGTIQDITGQKAYEHELREMVHIFQYANVGIVTGSPDDENLHRMNKTFAEMYGYTVKELSGKPIKTVFAPSYKHRVKDYIQKAHIEGNFIAEVSHMKKSGEEFPVLMSVQSVKTPEGKIDRRIISVQDISELKNIRDKLALEQARFESAAGVISDVIWDFNAVTGELWWSDGIETVFGYDREEILNDDEFWKKHIHEKDRERVLLTMKQAEESEESEWNESYRFMHSEGNFKYVDDSASIIRDEDGEIVRIIGAMVDKTIEREAEKVLKQSMDQYRLLFEQSPIPMWIYDLDTYRFLEVNDAAISKYGYTKDEFYNMTLFDIRSDEDSPYFKRNLLKTKNSASSFVEAKHLTKDGKEMIIEISASNIIYKGEKQRLIVANDITRQRRAEETKLRALVEGEEKERRRVAKELHDGLGQYLSAVNMNFESLAEEIQTFNRDEKEQFIHGLALLKRAMQETRTISQNLMPKAIEDYGLALAVESLIDDLEKNTKIEFHYYQNIKDLLIPYNIQINLYRIIQEAVNNAIRHSECQKIHIQLVESENDIILSIEDNGVGFVPDEAAESGLGLQSMETRASAVSGKFDISSRTGNGTIITVIVPL